MESNNNYANKTILENTNDIISIEPSKVYFYKLNDQISIKSSEQNIFEGRIILKNNTNNYLIFKFQISNYNSVIYSITPTIYFINPKGTINVNIRRFDKVYKIKLIIFGLYI